MEETVLNLSARIPKLISAAGGLREFAYLTSFVNVRIVMYIQSPDQTPRAARYPKLAAAHCVSSQSLIMALRPQEDTK